jgi:hypothetical protein
VGQYGFGAAMGLLDDAIREHLELKRRRGGDPSAIAREEREVLAPGLADEPTDEGVQIDGDGLLEPEVPLPSAPPAAPLGPHAGEDQEDLVADLSAGSQETAELDMQAVMEDDPAAADPASPVAPLVDEPALAGDPDETPEDDLLEWEFPDERDRESPPQNIPGQERLAFE